MISNDINLSMKVSDSNQNLTANLNTSGKSISTSMTKTSEVTQNYEKLYNLPKLNGKTLIGNTELDLRLRDVKVHILTNSEIEKLLR